LVRQLCLAQVTPRQRQVGVFVELATMELHFGSSLKAHSVQMIELDALLGRHGATGETADDATGHANLTLVAAQHHAEHDVLALAVAIS
jgi:hypothetical protein